MTNKLKIFQELSWFENPNFRAFIALFFSVIPFAFAPILIRLGENEISPLAVIFYRFFISALLLGLWKGLAREKSQDLSPSPGYTTQTLGLLFGSGICFVGTQLLWAWSLTQTTVANSSLLHSFTPLFATLGGWLFFGQRFDRRFIIGMIVTIIGSIVLGVNDFLYEPEQIQGDTIALISASFFAIYFLLTEQIRDQFQTLTLLFFYCVIGTVTILPFLLLNRQEIFPSSWGGWWTVIGLACTLLLVYGLTTYTLKWLSSGLVTVVLLIDPVLSGFLAWFIFTETLDLLNLLAFPVVLLGIYLASTSKSATKEGESIP